MGIFDSFIKDFLNEINDSFSQIFSSINFSILNPIKLSEDLRMVSIYFKISEDDYLTRVEKKM